MAIYLEGAVVSERRRKNVTNFWYRKCRTLATHISTDGVLRGDAENRENYDTVHRL